MDRKALDNLRDAHDFSLKNPDFQKGDVLKSQIVTVLCDIRDNLKYINETLEDIERKMKN